MASNVLMDQLHVGQSMLARFGAGQAQFDFVDISPDDFASRHNHSGHVEGHIAASATNFHAGHAGT